MQQPKQQFQVDGFVALPQFIDSDTLDSMQQNVQRLIDQVVPKIPSEQVYYEDIADATSLKQIQHLDHHDAWFASIFTRGRFRELAEALLDGPVVPKNIQYFNKPNHNSQSTPPHQDGQYFMLKPCSALTMWLALDKVDESNGCIHYVRGSHKLGMRKHRRTQTLGFSQGIVDYPHPEDVQHEVAVPAEPGDLLVHHALTIHRADRNKLSDRQRRAIGLIYYSAGAQIDHEAHKAYQRDLANDWRATGRL